MSFIKDIVKDIIHIMAKHNELGKLGETIAADFLQKKGFLIVQRNFSFKNLGEIDIVAKKSQKIYFIEVKSVSRERLEGDLGLPEENVTREKLRRLKHIISFYIEQNKIEEWEFLILAVFIDVQNKKAKVRLFNELLPE